MGQNCTVVWNQMEQIQLQEHSDEGEICIGMDMQIFTQNLLIIN